MSSVKRKNRYQVIYCLLAFLICLVPVCGMIRPGGEQPEETTDVQDLTDDARLPSLFKEDGSFNLYLLSEAGEWFRDHMGFRSEMVTADSAVRAGLLQTSPRDSVTAGSGGWLYYGASLDDYMGTEPMSERSLFNIAHTLSMTESLLSAEGASLVFAVAPNKNTLYPEHMPYYDLPASNTRAGKDEEEGLHNMDRLAVWLEKEGVRYADLKEALAQKAGRPDGQPEGALSEEQEPALLYHKQDSHWNNLGAAVAADAILAAAGKEAVSFAGLPGVWQSEPGFLFPAEIENGSGADRTGDLFRMMYPAMEYREEDYYFETFQTYAYVGEVGSTFDPRIQAVNPSAEGSLLMFRDSFGNALVPFFAQTYANSLFSRGLPYHLSSMDILRTIDPNSPVTVVIERAERFLPQMAQEPPLIAAQPVAGGVDLSSLGIAQEVKDFAIAEEEGLVKVSGILTDEDLPADGRIFVSVNNQALYEAFPVTVGEGEEAEDTGFIIYLTQEQAAQASAFKVMAQF